MLCRRCCAALSLTSARQILLWLLSLLLSFALPAGASVLYWQVEFLRTGWFVACAGLATAAAWGHTAPFLLTSALKRKPVYEDLAAYPRAQRVYDWGSYCMFVVTVGLVLEYSFNEYNGSFNSVISALSVVAGLVYTMRSLQLRVFRGLLSFTVAWFDIKARADRQRQRMLQEMVTMTVSRQLERRGSFDDTPAAPRREGDVVAVTISP